jgi:hypothetical protein
VARLRTRGLIILHSDILAEGQGGRREPVGVREYPVGKKEARELAAKTAAVGTPWEDLLERHAALTASEADYQ